MSFDGSDPCWIPDVPITADNEWRMRVAAFGDGYEQRTLDGINALGRKWSMQWLNRPAADLVAMDDFFVTEGAGSFPFRDPATGVTYNVMVDDWHIEWSPRRRVQGAWAYYGTMSATFKKANGVGIPGGGNAGSGLNFVFDTFTAPDATALQGHIGELGTPWVEHIAGSNVDFGRIYANRFASAGYPNIYRALGVPPSPNYYVQAYIDLVGAADASSIGVCGRMIPEASTFYLVDWQAGNWNLYRVQGTSALLGQWADPFTSGSRRVHLDMSGTLISMYVDGVQRASVIDPTPLTDAGFAGIWGGAAGNRQMNRFDAILRG